MVEATGAQADPDDVAAGYRLLERLRWGNTPRCAHCDSAAVAFLRPADGRARRTRTGAPTARRVWRCATCRRQFTALTGTVLHGTRIPLSAWVGVSADLARDGRVPPVPQVARAHGLSPDAARHLCRVLQAATHCAALQACLPSTGARAQPD